MLHKRFDTGHQDMKNAVNSMRITHLERFTTFFIYEMSDYTATPFTLSAFFLLVIILQQIYFVAMWLSDTFRKNFMSFMIFNVLLRKVYLIIMIVLFAQIE